MRRPSALRAAGLDVSAEQRRRLAVDLACTDDLDPLDAVPVDE